MIAFSIKTKKIPIRMIGTLEHMNHYLIHMFLEQTKMIRKEIHLNLEMKSFYRMSDRIAGLSAGLNLKADHMNREAVQLNRKSVEMKMEIVKT